MTHLTLIKHEQNPKQKPGAYMITESLSMYINLQILV
jgi:hypothetical protein